MPTFHYTVDGEPQETTAHELTPRQILQNANLDPAQRYLIEIRGKEQVSYQGRMDEALHMHEHQKFVTAFVGPVPVS